MNPTFTSLDAALFDLDGTLVRTFIDFPGMRRAVEELAADYRVGAAVTGETDVLEIVAKAANALGEPQKTSLRRDAHALLEAWEAEGCAHPEPIAGADELLRRLHEERGLPIAIITRNTRRIAEDLLQRMNLPYDVLIAREDTPEFKPHPAPVLVACQRLTVNPKNTSMTGDLWADIAAGKAAGVRITIGIQWAHDPPSRFSRCPPDFEVTSLAETLSLFLNHSPIKSL